MFTPKVDLRLRQVLRVVDSVAAGSQTWYGIMRATGSDAAIQMVISAVLNAAHLGTTFVPSPSFVREGPEHLDVRTRLGFVFNGIRSLVFAVATVRFVFRHRALAQHDRVWARAMAEQPMWKRITATDPHGEPFTRAAAVIALLSGIATYRQGTSNRVPGLFLQILSGASREVFPNLPIVGLAHTSRISTRWVAALGALLLLFSVPSLIASLRAALMSQETYEEHRRRWTDLTEGPS